jgi:hypothetical protein
MLLRLTPASEPAGVVRDSESGGCAVLHARLFTFCRYAVGEMRVKREGGRERFQI